MAGVVAPGAGFPLPPKRLVPTVATAAAEFADAVEPPKLNPVVAGAGAAPKALRAAVPNAGVEAGAPNAGAGVVPKPKADGCTVDVNAPDAGAAAGCACVEMAAA